VAAGRLVVMPFPLAGHRGHPARPARARLAALGLLMRPVPRYGGFRLLAAARQAGPRKLVRNFLGTARRVLLGRA
jgi:coenzyme F420 hydrogenase subunit beta